MRIIDWLFHYLSGEFLLNLPRRRSNGGTIILVRSLITSTFIYGLAILMSELLDPSTRMEFSWVALCSALKNTLPWYGAIFAGVYAALYARFSSQWSYLAGVYNQIKATEAQVAASSDLTSRAGQVVTEMKAGFIEDADELHLALKPMFAALIRTWSEDERVRTEFAKYAPGGRGRLELLLRDVNRVIQNYEKTFEKQAIKANPAQKHLQDGKD